jgi:hypothetical protein
VTLLRATMNHELPYECTGCGAVVLVKLAVKNCERCKPADGAAPTEPTPAPLASPMTAADALAVYLDSRGSLSLSVDAVALLAVCEEAGRRARAEVLEELRALAIPVPRTANTDWVAGALETRAALLGAVDGADK